MSEVLHAASAEAWLRQAVASPQIVRAGFDEFDFVRITRPRPPGPRSPNRSPRYGTITP